MKRYYTALFILLFCVFPVFSQEILHRTLPNGMEVVIKENKSSPSVALICFVKTGSIYEGKFLGAGISHFVEHLAIGSTTSVRSEEDYTDWVERIGGNSNAYTTFNHTAYFLDVNREFIADAIQILSETMQFSAFTEEEVAREKDVIIKEFVYRVAPPMASMSNRMMEVTYLKSHIRNEIIGDIELFKGLEREDLLKYYSERYVPNNMIFVISGDVDMEETFKMVKEAFKDFKQGSLKPVYNPVENPRVGEYKHIEEFDINQARGFITYLIPACNYRDFLAIDMAADILFYKRNSPVQYRLSEELELTNWVFSYLNQGYYSDEHSLNIVFEAREPKNMDIILEEIDKKIQEVIEEGISQEQISEVINRKRAEKILQIQTPMREAMNIGRNMLNYGLPDVYDIHMKEYERLAPEDIIWAIKHYYADTNRVVFYGVPLGTKALVEEKGEIMVSDISRSELDNIIVLHKQNTKDPMVHSYIHIPISSDYETLENAGSFQAMVDMMFWGGTKSFDSMEFESWLEDRYITLRANITQNGMYIQAKSLTSDFSELMSRLFEIFNNPVFNEREFELYKQRIRARHNRESDDPETHYEEFRNSVLYPGQKAGLSREKKLDILMNLKREDLVKMHSDYFRADSVICSFFGDLSLEDAERYAKNIYNRIPRGEIEGELTPLSVPGINDTFVDQTPFEQVSVILNFQAPNIFDEDYIAMSLIELALGSGFSGRILKATRRDSNLVYSAYPRYSATRDFGFFRISALTSYNKKDELIQVLQNEVQKIMDGDIKQDEIDTVINSWELQVQNAYVDSYIANTLCYWESVGLGYNHLNESISEFKKLTPERIQEVAKKYFSDMAVIISEPMEGVERKFD